MSKIFISYKRLDKEKVFPIVQEIRQKTDIDCWLDLEGIESGDQFQNVIIEAIENADIVIFMLSQNFIAPYKDEKTGKINLRRQTFPEREVMYALHHNKRLVPISLDGTTVFDCRWLEFNCSGLDCIEWNNIDQKNKLLQNLKRWVGKQDNTNSVDDIISVESDQERDGAGKKFVLIDWLKTSIVKFISIMLIALAVMAIAFSGLFRSYLKQKAIEISNDAIIYYDKYPQTPESYKKIKDAKFLLDKANVPYDNSTRIEVERRL